MHPTIVIAYNATGYAADALALGRLLADLQDAELLVATVLPDTPSTEATGREVQRAIRAELSEVRALAATVLDGGCEFEVWPIFGTRVSAGIQGLAVDRGAGLIVFGSTHHGPLGRVLLGSVAEEALHGSPCAVAIAPHGFRRHPAIEPRVVGVAFDGSPESVPALAAGHALARLVRATLRVIAVEPSALHRPVGHRGAIANELPRRCADLGDDVEVESVDLRGDPARELARASERLGLLVCGSRTLGPLRRVILGSVSAAVVRSAACPLIVVPRGVPPLTGAAASIATSALTHDADRFERLYQP